MTNDDAAGASIVTVFTASDMVSLISAKLVLDGEGIAYLSTGEGVHHLFGLGAVVGGYNMITGPMRLQVRREDAERARDALAEFDQGLNEHGVASPPLH